MTLLAIQQQRPQNRSHRERKRTPKMLKAICELVRDGLSVRHAAEKLHVHHTTVGRWRNELPDFDAAILQAEADFIDSQIANIRKAAKKNWQASAWLLERKWPAFFAQPQVQFNLPERKTQFVDFPTVVERLNEYERRRAEESLQKVVKGSVIDVPGLPPHDTGTR